MYYWEKIKQHASNWWSFGKEHLVGILFFVVLLIFFISSIFRLNIVNIYEKTETGENGNFVSQTVFVAGITLDNWLTWFSIVGLGCGLIWALYQYNKRKKEKQQEKAAEIAKDFADDLVERMGMISGVLRKNNEIKGMIESVVKSKKLSQFTTLEIAKILGNTKCFEKFDTILHSKEIQKEYKEMLNKRYSEKEQEKFESYFPLLIENTLNRLEAICISISSQAAGSQFIYNSLHQSFLYNVEVLSIEISSSNDNNFDKFYTNIIAVYNMWNKQKEKEIKKLKKTRKKIEQLNASADKKVKKTNSKVEKEITKLLSKKNETV